MRKRPVRRIWSRRVIAVLASYAVALQMLLPGFSTALAGPSAGLGIPVCSALAGEQPVSNGAGGERGDICLLACLTAPCGGGLVTEPAFSIAPPLVGVQAAHRRPEFARLGVNRGGGPSARGPPVA